MSNNDNKLDAMRHAGQVNLKAIEIATAAAQPGVRLEVLDDIIERAIRAGDCEPAFKGYHGFPGSACLSPNDVVVHGIPNKYKLRSGDILTIDVGTRYQGYCVDAARTIIVDGSEHLETEEGSRRYTLLHAAEAVMAAELDVVRAGCTLLDIVEAADAQANALGVRIIYEYGGHQIGKVIHERLDGYDDTFIPNTLDHSKGTFNVKLQKRKLSSYQLREGQTICIEPVVTFSESDIILDEDGWTVRTTDGADVAHTERCLIVTKDGYELLS